MRDAARITMVQMHDNHDAEDAMRRIGPFFEQAAAEKSDLVVFPEYILGHEMTLDHERIGRFKALAAQHHMYAIAGCVLKHGERHSTTALLIDRNGELLGHYYKCHPASGPGPHWWPPIPGWDGEARGWLGNQFKVFTLDFGSIGIIQCYDGYFPEAWGVTSFSGAEIILWINGRAGMVEDSNCMFAATAYGCAVGANISDGFNTGFTGPGGGGMSGQYIQAEGTPEEARLFPRIAKPGDACVTATIDLQGLRRHRKHLRSMHQRRPELYGLLTQDIRMWQNYPEIPWDMPECEGLVNKAQL